MVFKKQDVTGIAPHDLCRIGMGRSFQRTNIFPRLTVYENIQAAYLSHRGRGWNLFTPVDRLYREESLALLDAVGLAEFAGEIGDVDPAEEGDGLPDDHEPEGQPEPRADGDAEVGQAVQAHRE